MCLARPLPADGCGGNTEWAGRGCREGAGGCGRGGRCSPTLASSTFSRSVSSDTLLQLAQPVGGRRRGWGRGFQAPLETLSPWRQDGGREQTSDDPDP